MFEERGVRFIRQYPTVSFRKPTPQQRRQVQAETVTWQTGDRLEKLAGAHYGDPTYWWVIARYNQKPTDAHFSLGDLVYIPKPLRAILAYYV
tara:strand:- start:256 stop:531 length:276 start_codon:yes stop_codon:yes gene_type:complete